ncbi:hypothetical protein SASPL_148049 [Salvia splendens]|uniref:Solute carrier family 45, member 1/2/4 n=1 Tax=Salvia splendens TaxID=180675 RepID=A0A8X8Z407_SALSN|nr:hypothetical protein SASPL_148049 [Salvia splendens]
MTIQVDGAGPSSLEIQQLPPQQGKAPIRVIIEVAAIAAGVQFGWALQLSLLTPYVQLLGVPYTWAAFVRRCGPISALLVQPIAGYYSDHCKSRFGRRRPFIAAGAALVAVAVFLIGFAADIGVATARESSEAPSHRRVRRRILDSGSSTAPTTCCRGVQGFADGSIRWRSAADEHRKRALLLLHGEPDPAKKKQIPVFGELFIALKGLPKPMWIVMLVTAFNWVAWFPFLLFDTDWMGKEVYGGTVGVGTPYDQGVHAGADDQLGRASVRLAQGAVPVQGSAQGARHHGLDGVLLKPDSGVKIGALAIFGFLGIPLAVTFSIPFAVASIFSSDSGSGQDVFVHACMQMFVSVLSGPWDALFGGGNIPAFIVGAVSAVVSGILALTMLPSPPTGALTNLSGGGGY